jgi:D-glycero-alpha-D-manno-heptose-7-phosphate kinase
VIIIRTPLRVSFFGGGTDHPSWFRRGEPGAVLSTTINKYVYIQLRRLPSVFDFNYRVLWSKVEQVKSISEIEHPIVRTVLANYAAEDESGYEIVYNADLPARSGLGSSSSFTVAMLHAFLANQGRMSSKSYLAREAIRIEQDLLGEPVGSQDQVAAAYGGLNQIDFEGRDGVTVNRLGVAPARMKQLEDSLLLFFTGFIRSASEIEKKKIESFDQKQAELRRMYQMVGHGRAILESDSTSIDEFGALLHEAWRAKRSLSDNVSSSAIDDVYHAGLRAGAQGGKLLGAGGGGFLLFFAPPERHVAIREALKDLAYVPIRFEKDGSSVVLYNPELTANYEAAPAMQTPEEPIAAVAG